MAKGGYQSSGEPLTPEESFPEVVWFYEHSRKDRCREELDLILTEWREIIEIVATSPDKQRAMQRLMARFPWDSRPST